MQQNRRGLEGRWLAVVVAVVATLPAGGCDAVGHTKAATDHPAEAPPTNDEAAVSVEVVTPRAGGIDRVSTQPGSVEPFEAADLYAKVSGYLIEQKVDIGSRVKAGDVLARI